MRPAAGVRAVANQDGAVMLDIEHGQMLSANPLGARIWQLIAAGQTREQIAVSISQECSVDAEVVRRDVNEFIESLVRNHLVEEDLR